MPPISRLVPFVLSAVLLSGCGGSGYANPDAILSALANGPAACTETASLAVNPWDEPKELKRCPTAGGLISVATYESAAKQRADMDELVRAVVVYGPGWAIYMDPPGVLATDIQRAVGGEIRQQIG